VNIYNGYCYSTVQQIADLIVSEPVSISGSTFIYSQLVSISANTAVFTTPLGSYSRTFIMCNSEGPLLTDTHMSTADAVMLGWAIIGVWIVAWAFKSLRRTF
jgi:hypothetical protein